MGGKIIYLGAYKAQHYDHNIIYQDINGERDLGGDMLEIDLSPYDIIIATPPCNYYSKLNRFRDSSEYAQNTKHLLPEIIEKLHKNGKPYIVENVRSHIINSLIKSQKNYNGFIIQHGRHTYWTNIPFNPKGIKQKIDFKYIDKNKPQNHIINRTSKNGQGGDNVHDVIEYWLKNVKIEQGLISREAEGEI
ncbi:MAG: hypothetical protein M0R51_12415 [Clostridia bacterium]|jgi:hypothetical protein|nr:hypothetical protein [Clostridia bacterium]